MRNELKVIFSNTSLILSYLSLYFLFFKNYYNRFSLKPEYIFISIPLVWAIVSCFIYIIGWERDSLWDINVVYCADLAYSLNLNPYTDWSDNPAFGNNNHIIKNYYDDIDENCQWLIKFFKNKNYYKIKNKPVFYIHHPWEISIPKLNEIYRKLDLICKKNNFDGVHLKLNSQILDMNIDISFLDNKLFYDFNPAYKKNITNICIQKPNCAALLNYPDYIETIKMNSNTQTIFFDFDNYARLLIPDKLNKRTKCINNDICNHIYFIKKIKKYFNNKNEDDNDPFILLINAFNEWGEKMHIEPSENNGTYYLDLIKYFF